MRVRTVLRPGARVSGRAGSGFPASRAPRRPFCGRPEKGGVGGHALSGRPRPREKERRDGGRRCFSRGSTQFSPSSPPCPAKVGQQRRPATPAPAGPGPSLCRRGASELSGQRHGLPGGAWVLLLPALRPPQAVPPRGRLSRAYPGHAAGAGTQPGCASRSRAGGPSEGPVSPRVDLGGFLFPSSASVPFISGDGPQERKVTPLEPVQPGIAPSSFPGAVPSHPPTTIPSRWFRLSGVGCGGRGYGWVGGEPP